MKSDSFNLLNRGRKEGYMIEITPLLNLESKHPIYIQLYEYIKNEVEAGRLPSKSKLPSIRRLAANLHISQNTVESAYQQLFAEGYIDSKPRSGMYVMPLEEKLDTIKQPVETFSTVESYDEETSYTLDFYQGAIDLTHFPLNEWKKCSNEVLHHKDILQYGDHRQGERKLREQLVTYLYFSRGVNSSPDQIVIGAGLQHLLGMLSLLFRKKQYTIAIEDPGYKGAKDVFKNNGLTVHPIPVDRDGIHMDELVKSESDVLYITPSHQYPTGVITPINKRRQLLKWVNEAERYIIEDDYDSEFRYVGKPIPSLQGLDSNHKIIYIGTFSKSFLPSIRISYMVLPPSLLKMYKQLFASYVQTVSRIHQEALALFIEKGYLERHIRRMRKQNRHKRDTLLKAIAQYMGDHVSVIGEKSGVFILIKINELISESTLIERAKKVKVKVYPTSRYWSKRSTEYPMIQLGFGGLTEKEIEEGISLLSKAWFKES